MGMGSSVLLLAAFKSWISDQNLAPHSPYPCGEKCKFSISLVMFVGFYLV